MVARVAHQIEMVQIIILVVYCYWFEQWYLNYGTLANVDFSKAFTIGFNKIETHLATEIDTGLLEQEVVVEMHQKCLMDLTTAQVGFKLNNYGDMITKQLLWE